MKINWLKRREHGRAAKQRGAQQQLRFETLEERRLLAGVPELLKDINLGPVGSSARDFVEVGSITYFTASDAVGDHELWRTNGTSGGTVRVKDINPGSSGSYPSKLTNVNGTLFFSASDATGGRELWKSNGTELGTVRVKDIRPGTGSSTPYDLVNVSGTLFFSANDGANGRELWKSNGIALGTLLVKEINPGSSSASLNDFANVNGTLFFAADDGTTGTELWKSNGVDSGTVRVKDISLGNRGGFPERLTNVNGTLFFSATNLDYGRELWRSDGSDAGTVLVKDIWPGGGIHDNSNPYELTNVNDTLFFTATNPTNRRELWKSDGTSNGTILVKDLRSGNFGSYGSRLTNVNGTLFFTANDGTAGTELWKSNGTVNGTVPVKEIRPGSDSASPSSLVNVGGTLYFSANDGSNGAELWKSDGTALGTVLVKDIREGVAASEPKYLANANGTLYFRANDGVNGSELWVVRPQAEGVSLAIAATSANKNEGNLATTAFTFTVTRTGSLTSTTTVNYAVTGIGANPATAIDFVGSIFPSGTVTFAAGQATRVITIPVRGDTTLEADENFRVTISGASGGATITTAAALGVIRNDETSLAIAATKASKSEGNAGTTVFSFTVTRSGLLTSATTVNYAVTGLGTNPATAADFVGSILPSGVVTFAAGQATRVVSILVRGDTTVEANENFRVTLSSPSGGATLAVASAVGLISNDDSSLAIAPLSADKSEGLSGATLFTFTVTRSGSHTETSTVNYVVTGIGANPATAADFTANILPSGTITFAAGEATKVISIVVRGDLTVEADEGFRVTLSGASLGTSITNALASGLIRNDDV